MDALDTFIAVTRFGLGASARDVRNASRAPRAWLEQQTSTIAQTPAALSRFAPSEEVVRAIHQARMESDRTLKKAMRKSSRRDFRREVVARMRHMVTTDEPFRERMVLFWSNHFTVSRTRAIVGPVIPAYEREAIRPHVFGRFSDMLQAATRHVAMLTYLDNDRSMGPNSRLGRRTGRGLNENLAREVLELHTLGVNGGYTQRDVTEFAKALTGWTHDGRRRRNAGDIKGRFIFRKGMHEPGAKTVLGKRYAHTGASEAQGVLEDLARHPATAQVIATKLVRHFVADDPPAADVERIARVFADTDGDLAAVARAVVNLESVWATPLPKVKAPRELLISTFRALQIPRPRGKDMAVALKTLGQRPFHAPSPQGWPDEARHWLAPQSLLRRIEWLRAVAVRAPARSSPQDLLEQTIGPVASPETRRMVAGAPSADAGVALVLASAEFQRR